MYRRTPASWCAPETRWFSPADLELRRGTPRAFGLPLYSVGGELRVGVGSAGCDGRIRRHAGIGGSGSFGSVRRPDISAPAIFQGSGYTGEVSTLQGHLSLSPLLSEVLFEVYVLPSLPCATRGRMSRLGLAPYALRQDLYASLSGGPLSVGAVPYSVDLEGRHNRARINSWSERRALRPIQRYPEPAIRGAIFGWAEHCCAGFPAILPRIFRRAAVRREKSTVCIR